MRGAFLLLFLPACELASGANDFEVSEIVGDWESELTVEGEKTEAHLFGDGRGEARIPVLAMPMPGVYEVAVVHVDATWEETDDNEFEIELICDDAAVCNETLLTKEQRTYYVDCETKNDARILACRGRGDSDEPFELVRVEH
jgi:hypothetical protein